VVAVGGKMLWMMPRSWDRRWHYFQGTVACLVLEATYSQVASSRELMTVMQLLLRSDFAQMLALGHPVTESGSHFFVCQTI